MKTITVQVQDDHLEVLSRTKPMSAMAELIWNALDAEATELRVEFDENELQGIERIRIIDNGHGLHYDDAFIVFQNLGGSWKRAGFRTHMRKRALHGKYGKGRFRAFSLGNDVSWHSVYQEAGDCFEYAISGRAETLGEFQISNCKGCPEGAATGMVVDIACVPETAELLRGVKALSEVTDIFALYLRQYPDVHITYDGTPIDPANAEERYTEYGLGELVMENGERVSATLTVVEWSQPGRRGVFLCDGEGFMLYNALPRLHFRGFSYTAYVKSAHLAELDREGLLQAGDLSPDVRQILDAARARLREHFTLREAEQAQDTVADWKELGIYPYDGKAVSDSDVNERRIFDIYATHLDQIFPEFGTSRVRHKGLTLRLIRELVHTEPTRMARILDELLSFPEGKEDEVRELLEA